MAQRKLHGMPMSPNVVRVAAALNEKGLEFEIVPVDIRTSAHKHPDFLALNPFGQIPALQDGDEVLYGAIWRDDVGKVLGASTMLRGRCAATKPYVLLQTVI